MRRPGPGPGRSQDLVSQEPDLKRWADGQNTPIAWYRDGFTGKSMDRPGWNKFMKVVQDGTGPALVVWRLDRLGRTANGLTALFEAEEPGLSVKLGLPSMLKTARDHCAIFRRIRHKGLAHNDVKSALGQKAEEPVRPGLGDGEALIHYLQELRGRREETPHYRRW